MIVNKLYCSTLFSSRPQFISSAKCWTIVGVGGVPQVSKRWMRPRSTFFWLALGSCRYFLIASWFEPIFPIYRLSILYVLLYAFLQLLCNLQLLVILNPQARPKSDQYCSWYCCLKIVNLFLVGCVSSESVHYVIIDVSSRRVELTLTSRKPSLLCPASFASGLEIMQSSSMPVVSR